MIECSNGNWFSIEYEILSHPGVFPLKEWSTLVSSERQISLSIFSVVFDGIIGYGSDLYFCIWNSARKLESAELSDQNLFKILAMWFLLLVSVEYVLSVCRLSMLKWVLYPVCLIIFFHRRFVKVDGFIVDINFSIDFLFSILISLFSRALILCILLSSDCFCFF